ncbi:hypothetical protein EV426DRAFT_700915 [Tirmania nivea]|nr:hypothetical protein EV426DRAFT_700915 [Tirmania nivea]
MAFRTQFLKKLSLTHALPQSSLMSTKNFILKIQSPTSITSSKSYILALNTRFTTSHFISDLQELYPPTKEAKQPILMLEGTYRMMPRQFLRYMRDSVDYKPAVRHGVYVPSMFGQGNMVKIVYEEEDERSAAESMTIDAPAPVAQNATVAVTQNPADTGHGVVKVDKAIALPSNSTQALSEKVTPQPQGCQSKEMVNAHFPTHENTPHELFVSFGAGTGSGLQKYELGAIWVPVPASGGKIECLQLLPKIKSGLKRWLDPANIELGLTTGYDIAPPGAYIKWNENSFKWEDLGPSTGKWLIYVGLLRSRVTLNPMAPPILTCGRMPGTLKELSEAQNSSNRRHQQENKSESRLGNEAWVVGDESAMGCAGARVVS